VNRRWTRPAAALAAAGAACLALVTTAQPAAGAAPAYAVAPYVDMSNSQETLLDKAATTAGLKYYTAAFVIGSGCNQIWGDTLPIGNDPYTDPLIAKARSEGANPIISSGGAAGWPLAWTCTTQSSIVAGYKAILSDYGVNWLDFDIEGSAVAYPDAIARQMQAMKSIKASNANFRFSVTLPVLPSGLTADGVNIIKAAKTAGVKIDVVNVMSMDYYQGNQDMGQAAINAAKATLTQLKSVDSSYTYANVGDTPMIGTNDDGSTFSKANASTLITWANSVHLGRVAFWAVTRDQSCGSSATGTVHPDASSTCSGVSQSPLDFTKAFLKFTG
jgi:hypothetical protein